MADGKGYMWDFWLYQGDQPPTHALVLEFVQKLRNVHPNMTFTVYCDSYYGSWNLAQGMKSKVIL